MLEQQSGLGIMYNAFFLSFTQFVFLIHLGILSLLYISPFTIAGVEFSLRKFPLAKIFVLTYVWASVTVFLPGFDLENWNSAKIVIVFLERFLFILALAIPFDIRDYMRDKKEMVKTIPGIIGVSNSKKLSIIILLVYMLVSITVHELDYVAISRILSGALAIFLIHRINEKVSDSYYMFFIDGVMVFHFIVLSVASFLLY
jgi:4-hydroxybenzoate polyprenyltransferase